MSDEMTKSSPADHYFEPVGESATAKNISSVLNDFTAMIEDEVEEKKNAVLLSLETDAEGIKHFILGEAGMDVPPIEAEENELLLGDGENWAVGGDWYSDHLVFTPLKTYRSYILDEPTETCPQGVVTAKILYTELQPLRGALGGETQPIVISGKPTYVSADPSGPTLYEKLDHWEVQSPFLCIADETNVFFDGKTHLGIHGQSDISIGEGVNKWPGNFYEKELYHPYIDMHGPVYTVIDAGTSGGTNCIVSHGNVFIDISDAANYNTKRRKGTFEDKVYPNAARPWTKQGQSIGATGPWIHVHGDPAIIVDGAPEVKLDDYAQLCFTGDCLFRMQGSTNPFEGMKTEFVVEPGAHVKFSQRNSSRGNPVFILDENQFFFGTKAESNFSITEYKVGTFIDSIFAYWPDNIFSKSLPYSINSNGNGIESKHIVTLASLSYEDHDTAITRCSQYGPSVLMQGNALVQIGGRGYTCMQIAAETGALFDLSITPQLDSTTEIKFGGGYNSSFLADITPSQNSETYIKFGGEDDSKFHIIADPARSSNTLLKFSPGRESNFTAIIDPARESETDIKFSPKGLNTIYYTPNDESHIRFQPEGPYHLLVDAKNAFIQQDGNMHHEMHNDSTFIMRGATTDVPYCDTQGTMLGKQSHMGLDWSRPVSPRQGPVFQMYERSNFIMRGNWEPKIETVYRYDTDTVGYSMNKDDEGNIALFISSGDKDRFIEGREALGFTVLSIEAVYKANTSSGNSINIEYKAKKTEWEEYIDFTGDPILEITDTSQLRLHKGASINADEEGVTFIENITDEESFIHFTWDELKALKALCKADVSQLLSTLSSLIGDGINELN